MSTVVYEQLMRVLSKRKQDMIRSVVAKVKEMQADYNIEQIAHKLSLEGHNEDVIDAAIKVAFDGSIIDSKPPENYEDVRTIIEATLASEHPRKIVKALTSRTKIGQIIPSHMAEALNLEYLIAYAQNQKSKAVINEIHKDLKPFIENVLVNVALLSKEKTKKIAGLSDADREVHDLWFDMFGIWTPDTIKSYYKTAICSDNLILSSTYEDGKEYTYCPKDKTEITVDNVCKQSCPFYRMIHTASGEYQHFCKFKH